MGNHRDTAARIWRTIVCSGAMLGVPLGAAAETPKPEPVKQEPAKPADAKLAPTKPAKPVPVGTAIAKELEQELAKVDPEVKQALAAVEKAASDAERTAAKTKLTALQRDQANLKAAVKLAKSATDAPSLTARATDKVTSAKTEPEREGARLVLQHLGKATLPTAEQDFVARANQALDEIGAAQNDADRAAAKTKLAAVQKEVAEKQKRARAAAERNRPVGRGFILA